MTAIAVAVASLSADAGAAIAPPPPKTAAPPPTRPTVLFIDPQLPAARWVAAHPTDPRAAAIRAAISDQPMAHWFTGTSDADVGTAVATYTQAAAAAGALP